MTHRVGALCVVLVAGCASDATAVSVSFEFDPPELRDEAVFVEVHAGLEDCAAPRVSEPSRPALRLDRTGSSPATLEVDRPTYLHARARDRSCRWFARGCGRVEPSSPARITLDLRPTDALPMCLPGDCDEGACAGGDLPEGIAPPATDAGPGPPPLDDGRDA